MLVNYVYPVHQNTSYLCYSYVRNTCILYIVKYKSNLALFGLGELYFHTRWGPPVVLVCLKVDLDLNFDRKSKFFQQLGFVHF